MNLKYSLLGASIALALSAAVAQAQTMPQSSPPTTTMPSNPANTSPTDPNSTRSSSIPTVPPQPVPPENNRASPATPAPNVPPTVNQQPLAFKDLDRNNDGSISRSEADADLSLSFAQYDVNGDGMLSADEYAKYRAYREQLARTRESDPTRRF